MSRFVAIHLTCKDTVVHQLITDKMLNETDDERSKRFRKSRQRTVPFTEQDFCGAQKMATGRPKHIEDR